MRSASLPAEPGSLAYLTQTTLSVDDTAEIVAVLERRFPGIRGPKGEDICYATSNRQAAVKDIARRLRGDAGDRLAEELQFGPPGRGRRARGHPGPADRPGRRDRARPGWTGSRTLGITAGASAPETLVREVVDFLARHYDVTEIEGEGVVERMVFKLPRGLEAA